MIKVKKLQRLLADLKIPYTMVTYSEKWDIGCIGNSMFLDSEDYYLFINRGNQVYLRKLGVEENLIEKFEKILNKEGKACVKSYNRHKKWNKYTV